MERETIPNLILPTEEFRWKTMPFSSHRDIWLVEKGRSDVSVPSERLVYFESFTQPDFMGKV